MIKFVRQKNRENSLKETKTTTKITAITTISSTATTTATKSTTATAKNFLRKKRESNDSGTESDGDILDVEKQRHLDLDMETSLSSCTADANLSPTTTATTPKDTACSTETSFVATTTTTNNKTAASKNAAVAAAAAAAAAAMMCQSSHLQMYDQHSSEEELEVINGPAAAEAGVGSTLITAQRSDTDPSTRESARGCTSSLDPEELYAAEATTSKRSSSTLVENRKRSLAHSSDDELRNFLEPILTPVNFRTSPPLEAFKPNRSHMFRSTTPLILSEARCGIENIKLCDNSSVNEENGGGSGGNLGGESNGKVNMKIAGAAAAATAEGCENEPGGGCGGSSVIKACSSSLKMSNSSHHIYQPQPKYSFHYNSSRSSPASTTALDMEVVRSVSPPAKLFHCAISPRRRPMRGGGGGATSSSSSQAAAAGTTTQHATQRLQRPHRPCLDFDKMQQVSL